MVIGLILHNQNNDFVLLNVSISMLSLQLGDERHFYKIDLISLLVEILNTLKVNPLKILEKKLLKLPMILKILSTSIIYSILVFDLTNFEFATRKDTSHYRLSRAILKPLIPSHYYDIIICNGEIRIRAPTSFAQVMRVHIIRTINNS